MDEVQDTMGQAIWVSVVLMNDMMMDEWMQVCSAMEQIVLEVHWNKKKDEEIEHNRGPTFDLIMNIIIS